MFRNKTVVVVGAGASFEAGLPFGHALKSSISKLTKFTLEYGRIKSGDHDFWQELMRSPHFSGNQQRIYAACSKISRGIHYVSSVDSFLEIHRSDADIQHCAKAAISRLILDGERKSNFTSVPTTFTIPLILPSWRRRGTKSWHKQFLKA